MPLKNIKIILIEPQTPGNIGAVARAMKTMSLSQLILIKPKIFPHKDAYIRATNATNILDNCVVADTLVEVISDCTLVIGSSIRDRGDFVPPLTVKQAAKKIVEESAKSSIALIFGTESSGMTGKDIRLCNYYGFIPSNPDFSSLNLASAVQIFCYEIYQESLLIDSSANKKRLNSEIDNTDYPSNKQLSFFYDKFEEILVKSQFINPKHPGLIMQRLRGLFNRARLNHKEISILQGILSSVKQKMK